MCDYSLHHVASRPARVGDKLVTTRFENSITRGFAAAEEPGVAVCLLPGTEIAFDDDVECANIFARVGLGFGKVGEKVARFRRINEAQRDAHHDALEFPSGKVVLVTRLCTGQCATVLQLPASHRASMPERQVASAPAPADPTPVT
jgi:hypothetical protein